MTNYFLFNGVDSSDYLVINKLPPIIKAEKNVQKVEIEGRDGFLTIDYGSYKSILKPVQCTIKDLTNIDYICGWLTGSGDIIFSNESDKVYKATIIDKIELKRGIANTYNFTINFDCQPFKYAISNEPVTLTTSPATIYNSGTTSAKPVIQIYGSGNIDLNINSSVIHLTNVTDYVTIDSVLMDCYKDTVLMNSNMNGDFPELAVGNNTISWTGTVSKLEITQNIRYL